MRRPRRIHPTSNQLLRLRLRMLVILVLPHLPEKLESTRSKSEFSTTIVPPMMSQMR